MLTHNIVYRVAEAAGTALVIKSAVRTDINALGITITLIPGITQITDEGLIRYRRVDSDCRGGTSTLAEEAFLPEASFLVKYHVQRIPVEVNGRRVERTGFFTLSLLGRACNAGHLHRLR